MNIRDCTAIVSTRTSINHLKTKYYKEYRIFIIFAIRYVYNNLNKKDTKQLGTNLHYIGKKYINNTI